MAATAISPSRHTAIRLLGPADRGPMRALRARALETDPDAFGRTAAEEAAMARIGIESALDQPGPATFLLGAFDPAGAMVGMAAAFQGQSAKTRHRASLNALYVVPECRGQGVGQHLVRDALGRLRLAGLRIASLSVVADPPQARRFYERLGFLAYGVEPEGLRLDDRSFDLVLMGCDLRAPPATPP